jgi:hypothetical protein
MAKSHVSNLDPLMRTFAPALPMTTFAYHLARDGYSELDVRVIIHDTEVAENESRSHQLRFCRS